MRQPASTPRSLVDGTAAAASCLACWLTQRSVSIEIESRSADWDSPAGGGDGNGVLDREEVVRALVKTLRLSTDAASVQQMRSTIDAIWGIFDTDGSGTTERREFLQADGLADTIVATLGQR